MVKTKCIKDPIEKSDGRRLVVTRYFPRFTSKDKLKADYLPALAPSRELHKQWYAGDLTWGQFVASYKMEMKERTSEIATLATEADKGTITLLCYEEESDPHCHRHILKKLIERKLKKK